MGYVAIDTAAPGSDLQVILRDRPLAAKVASLPFVPHRYYRG
jgi:aminomethyltransferase